MAASWARRCAPKRLAKTLRRPPVGGSAEAEAPGGNQLPHQIPSRSALTSGWPWRPSAMDKTDIDALKRCLAAARAEDAGRARQIDLMLADQTRNWESAASSPRHARRAVRWICRHGNRRRSAPACAIWTNRMATRAANVNPPSCSSVCAIAIYRYSSPIRWPHAKPPSCAGP